MSGCLSKWDFEEKSTPITDATSFGDLSRKFFVLETHISQSLESLFYETFITSSRDVSQLELNASSKMTERIF